MYKQTIHEPLHMKHPKKVSQTLDQFYFVSRYAGIVLYRNINLNILASGSLIRKSQLLIFILY